MTPEGKIQKQIITRLNQLGYTVLRINPTGLYLPDRVIQSGIPDLLAFGKGDLFFVEVKQPGQEPRKLQHHVMGLLRNVGVTCFTWSSVDDLASDLSL